MRVAIYALVTFICIAFVAVSEAHKSVRHIKPQTEELREIHHQAMWTRPPKEDGDEVFMRKMRSEYDPLDHSHKSHHRRWGPSHPDHTMHKNWHYKAPRFHNGERVGDEVMDEDLHLFGLSKRHNEIH